jgi:hypothetical protein
MSWLPAGGPARPPRAAWGGAGTSSWKSGNEATPVLEAILAHGPNADPQALTRLRYAKRVGPSHARGSPTSMS